MLTPPSLPAWNAMHPLVVHFPIALSFVVPVFVMAAACLPRRAASASVCWGLVLLALAVGSMFLATATGELAEELAESAVGGASATLERHESFAMTARWLFVVLSIVLASLQGSLFLLGRRKPVAPWIVRGAYVGFVALYLPALIVLVNAAHAGGQLVHRDGIHAAIDGLPAGASATPSARSRHDDDD